MHKKPTYKPVRRKHKRLVLALVFILASFSGLHVRHNDASISRSAREENVVLSLVLVLASLRRTCKPGRRMHGIK